MDKVYITTVEDIEQTLCKICASELDERFEREPFEDIVAYNAIYKLWDMLHYNASEMYSLPQDDLERLSGYIPGKSELGYELFVSKALTHLHSNMNLHILTMSF
jgi:hypothetical protein